MVQSILSKYIDFEQPEDWKRLDFTYVPLKFKVVRDCMAISGLQISNVELTNIVDAPSLVECLEAKWRLREQFGTSDLSDPVKLFFKARREELPENLYYTETPNEQRELLQSRLKEEKEEFQRDLL